MTRLPAELLKKLRKVRSVGAITGAGLSAASGIPTYRGKGGLYDDPEQGEQMIEALTGTTLQSDPARTWLALKSVALLAQKAIPNAGHNALARIEQQVERCVLLTQNVDGLHQLAGSKNVIPIHGDARATLCQSCGARGRIDDFNALPSLPRCSTCDGILRPDVVLFGEMLPSLPLLRMHAEFHEHIPDLIIVSGTTALFPYIAEPVVLARREGHLTVEVNPEPTFLSRIVEFSLRGRADELLPLLADALA